VPADWLRVAAGPRNAAWHPRVWSTGSRRNARRGPQPRVDCRRRTLTSAANRPSPRNQLPRVTVFPPGSNDDMNENDQTCGRLDVDETLPSIKVPRYILNELYSHALETLPEECCGLIVGTDQNRFRRFVRCRNEMTLQHRKDPVAFPRDGRRAFLMNGLDYMRVIDEAEECGEIVTAVYHSHIDAGAYLSAMDREYAESTLFPFPGADQVVVSVVDGNVDSVAFFRHDDPACDFFGHTIVPTAE